MTNFLIGRNAISKMPGAKLEMRLNRLKDERTGIDWKKAFTEKQIETIYEMYEALEAEGLNNFRFNPVYVCKEIVADWDKYKNIPEAIELIYLVLRSAERK